MVPRLISSGSYWLSAQASLEKREAPGVSQFIRGFKTFIKQQHSIKSFINDFLKSQAIVKDPVSMSLPYDDDLNYLTEIKVVAIAHIMYFSMFTEFYLKITIRTKLKQ